MGGMQPGSRGCVTHWQVTMDGLQHGSCGLHLCTTLACASQTQQSGGAQCPCCTPPHWSPLPIDCCPLLQCRCDFTVCRTGEGCLLQGTNLLCLQLADLPGQLLEARARLLHLIRHLARFLRLGGALLLQLQQDRQAALSLCCAASGAAQPGKTHPHSAAQLWPPVPCHTWGMGLTVAGNRITCRLRGWTSTSQSRQGPTALHQSRMKPV